MPRAFTLTKKTDLEAGPVPFTKIDEELCKHFDVPCHPTDWYMMWYDVVGLALVTGKSLADLLRMETTRIAADKEELGKEQPGAEQWLKILTWLETNYVGDAWWEAKR